MRRIRVAAAAAAIVAALVPSGCGGHSAQSANADIPAPGDVWRSGGFFGTNAPLLRAYTAPGQASSLDALAAGMASAGIDWARVVFDQSVEQRLPNGTDWTVPDTVVGALARHGIRTDAVFVGTAPRDAATALLCGSFAYPANVDGWAGFVGDAVKRYGRGGDFWAEHPDIPATPIETWEIANEENIHEFWCPAADPEQYAKVYGASRLAAHRADEDAQVIVGGLAPTFDTAPPGGDVNVADFLKRMVSADPALAHEIPAVGVHLYGPNAQVDLLELRAYRQALDGAGLEKTPMIANEAGWHTSGPHDARFAPEPERASFIRELASESRRTNCNVVGFGVHAWVTAQRDPANPEDWYGLADPASGALNPSGQAYAAGIREAEGSAPRPDKGGLGRLCG